MTRVLRWHRHRILAALILVAAALAALLYWQLSPIGSVMPEALAALESDDAVHVDRERWIAFEPQAGETSNGFIFYPGGRVPPEAYAPLARALAEQGHLSVIAPMPLNLAVFDPNAASAVIAAHPKIQTWVIGGHSLGGVMAARFAQENRGTVSGLVLLAAYPEAHLDLSESGLAVALLYADRDGLVTLDEAQAALAQLPAEAQAILIEGGNHAGFGWYGEQAGDRSARINREQQQTQVVAAAMRILREAGSRI